MLDTNITTHIFCGLRTKQSAEIYKQYLNSKNVHFAFSQEENREYVQDVITKEEKLIASVLKNKGVIMICGSIAMMNEVLAVLESITQKHLNSNLKNFEHQIKTDCY